MQRCPHCGLNPLDCQCFVDKTAEMAPDPYLGRLLMGRYQIESRLGEGAMATVYRARSMLVEHPVAVKIMNASEVRDPTLKERFRREAKNTAAVAHENIIDILDHGEMEDGVPFLVMELLEGMTLAELIASGPLGPGYVATLGVQIAAGLARAHDFSVLHRDLKPENIFVCRDARNRLNRVKILDFGIARSLHDPRMTAAGQVYGTPQYMAPERVTSPEAGPSADLYALGVILFEMVTGQLPFMAEEITRLFIKHIQEIPPSPSQWVPDLPPALEDTILSLLQKKPEDRPVDAHAVIQSLTPLLPKLRSIAAPKSESPAASTPSAPPAPLLWGQRLELLGQMLDRSYGPDQAPIEQQVLLSSMRELIEQSAHLRAEGLRCQRELDALQERATESRLRIGHAVHVLGQDLSRIRQVCRDRARQERDPGPLGNREHSSTLERPATPSLSTTQSISQLKAHVGAAFKALASDDAEGVQRALSDDTMPSESMVRAAKRLADSLEAWRSSALQIPAVASNEGLSELKDLEFQVTALRGQLERVEARYERERATAARTLDSQGQELEELDGQLTHLGSTLIEPLRERRELTEMFKVLGQVNTWGARG